MKIKDPATVVLVVVAALAFARIAEASDRAPEAAAQAAKEMGVRVALVAAGLLIAKLAWPAALTTVAGAWIFAGAVVVALWAAGVLPAAADALGIPLPTLRSLLGEDLEGRDCPPGAQRVDSAGRVHGVCLGFGDRDRPTGFAPTP